MLLLMIACATPVDTWELVALNQDMSVLDIELQRDDLGLLAGQGHLRLDLARKDAATLSFRRDALPEEVEPTVDGLAVGPDRFARSGDRWDLLLREEELAARLTLTPAGQGPPPLSWSTGRGDWTVSAPIAGGRLTGFVRAGPRDEFVDAQAVLLHRYGDDPPGLRRQPRQTVMVTSGPVTLVVDHTGSRALGWISMDGAVRATDGGVIERPGQGRLTVDLRPEIDVVAQVLLRPSGSLELELQRHLTTPERWLLRAGRAWPVRTVQSGRARISAGGKDLDARALVALVDYL